MLPIRDSYGHLVLAFDMDLLLEQQFFYRSVSTILDLSHCLSNHCS